MKFITTILALFSSSFILTAQHAETDPNTVLLDLMQKKNAGIKTTAPVVSTFQTTLFCIGRIQAIPSNRTVVSSRISGRVISKPPVVGDRVEKGDTILQVESRQPGSPPPVIPVTAPASGTVFESHVHLGEPVDPSEELMDIIDIRQVWAVANIPESKASRVKIGQKAIIKVVSIGNETFEGTLVRFGTQADAGTGTLQAIFLLDNPERKLRPNMLTEFNIVTKTREKVFTVPNSAVQGDRLNAHLFKIDYELTTKTSKAYTKVPFVLGEVNDRVTEVILQGKELNIVDEVVISGGYFLSHTSSADKGSLKEALDAAHGHEHNEDGSEMNAAEKAAAANKKAGGAGGTATSGTSFTYTILLIAGNIILALLLLFTIFKKKDIN
jgi:multidrug efflux pump subunit AcrA (membrane-fusion protein)